MSANASPSPLPLKRHGSNNRQRAKGAVLVRLLPDERAAAEQKAREVGLSLASFFRACGLGTPGPRARRSPPVNAEELARATAALNRVGNNLNQAVHIMNSGGSNITAQEVSAVLAETRAAVRRILEIVGRKDRK